MPTIRFQVRGVTFDRQDTLASLEGEKDWSVSLRPEEDNDHDPFAVAVHTKAGMIGYVPVELSEGIHEAIEDGRVGNPCLDIGYSHGRYWASVEVDVMEVS